MHKINSFNQMKSSLLKNSLNFGAVSAVIIIIVYLMAYIFLGESDSLLVKLISFLINILIIIWGTISFRDKVQHGQISYGKSMGSGVLISLSMAIIVSVYMFVFYKLIAPQEIGKILSSAEEGFYNRGMSDDQVEMQMQVITKFTTPITLAIGTVFSYTFWGVIFSLITSAFLKKSGESYQQIMSEIEKDIKNENQNNNE